MKKTKTAPTPPAPRPAEISAEQLAGLSNLTKRRLYQLADEHKIPQPTNGMFPMLATISALFSFYQRDGADLAREKLLKTSAERRIKERELAALEGTIMNAAVARATIAAALKRYHNIVRTQLERLDIKAVTDFHAALGLSDEQQAALHAFHLELARATTDKIEETCELIGRGDLPAQS
jgi:hypothetical protein